MFFFTYDLTISSKLTIRLDVEVLVDPPEPQTDDCPGCDGRVDDIIVRHNGAICTDDLAECVMNDICDLAEKKLEEAGDE